jgi:hypothetical protein
MSEIPQEGLFKHMVRADLQRASERSKICTFRPGVVALGNSVEEITSAMEWG